MLAPKLEILVYRLWQGRFRRVFRAIVSRMLGSRVQVVMGPLKGQLYLPSQVPGLLGIYELHVQRVLVNLLHEGDTFYDVGAHKGYLGLLGSRLVGEQGAVYEFEPLPENVACIKEVMEKNAVCNYTLVPKAICNVLGTIEFYYDNRRSTTASLHCGGRTKHRLVPATTLDAFAADNRFPHVIKVDVEGAEALVLEGAKNLMANSNAPTWIIEVHSEDTDREVKRLLAANSYQVCLLNPPVKPDERFPYQILASKGAGGEQPIQVPGE